MTKSEDNYEANQGVAGAASQKAESEANYEAEQEVAEVAGAASQKAESEANYEAFQKRLPKLLKSRHKGRYALMHNLKIKEFFMDYDEAVVQGHKRYRGNPFSVQHITDEPTSIYEPTDL